MQPEQDRTNWQQPQQPMTSEYHTVTPPVVQPPTPPVQQPAVTPTPNAPTSAAAPVATPAPTSPIQAPEPIAPEAVAPEYPPAQPPVESFTETTDLPQAYSDDPDDDQELIRWEATEVIDHNRPAAWYAILGVITAIMIALAIFLLHSISFALLIPIMAAALIVYTRKPPAHIQYILSRKGLHINDRLAAYENFRAFSVISHAGHNSIILIPRKRFALGETVYFPDEAGETIVDMMAARLPMKQTEPDFFDRIISRLRL